MSHPHHYIHLNKQTAFVHEWMNEHVFALTTKQEQKVMVNECGNRR